MPRAPFEPGIGRRGTTRSSRVMREHGRRLDRSASSEIDELHDRGDGIIAVGMRSRTGSGKRRSRSSSASYVVELRDGRIVRLEQLPRAAPKPSKPPGCRSRRCRRRTWRSSGACTRPSTDGDLRHVALDYFDPEVVMDASAPSCRWTYGLPRPRGDRRRFLAEWIDDLGRFPRRGRRGASTLGDRVVAGSAPSAGRARAAGSTLDERLRYRLYGCETARSLAWTRLSTTRPRPSKPPGCRSRRCRRRTWSWCGAPSSASTRADPRRVDQCGIWSPEIVWDATPSWHSWTRRLSRPRRGQDVLRRRLVRGVPLRRVGGRGRRADRPGDQVIAMSRQRGRGASSGAVRSLSLHRSPRCATDRSCGSTIYLDRAKALEAAGLRE